MQQRVGRVLRDEEAERSQTDLMGYLFLFFLWATCGVWFVFFFRSEISAWMNEDYYDISRESYYSFLTAAMIPATIFFIIVNWVSLKFFRHNN
jgi:hypothetical protein